MFNLHRRPRPIARIPPHFRNFVRHVLSFHDLSKNTVPVVQPRRRCHGNKKLAPVRPRSRIRHGQLSLRRMPQGRMKLIPELVPRPAHSRALRASALNHEVRNHAMKNQPVEERPFFLRSRSFIDELFRPFRKPHKIRHSIRRLFLQQPNHNIPHRRLKNRVRSRCPSHCFSFSSTRFSSYTTRFTHATAPRRSIRIFSRYSFERGSFLIFYRFYTSCVSAGEPLSKRPV